MDTIALFQTQAIYICSDNGDIWKISNVNCEQRSSTANMPHMKLAYLLGTVYVMFDVTHFL